jgi:alanine dehydrogenase
VDLLSAGVVATSLKPDERRLPIHPAHIERISPPVRERLFLERGYGERFGVSDEQLEPLVGGLRPRDELLAQSDVVILPKPLTEDLEALRPGQVVWGWPHCVQDQRIAQLAIDSRLTLIAFEAMNHWTVHGNFSVHVFHKNNELAGYASVLHAMQLLGSTGDYGRRLTAAVISFGATARGAVRALSALGISDVTVLTQRPTSAVASPFASVKMRRFKPGQPLAEDLAKHDIVVNCILQNTENPLIFVANEDLDRFKPGSLFVDVSCDEGMGFEWARPTTFTDPMFCVGDGLHYYAVDHSPSFLWNSATWENSEALLEYLPVVMSGPAAWSTNETIERAIEIREGVIQNPRIISFQGRSATFPYDIV